MGKIMGVSDSRVKKFGGVTIHHNPGLGVDALVDAQIVRILADGGTIVHADWMRNVIYTLKAQGIYTSCKFLADANFAYKNATGVTTWYDISGNNNDAVQATAGNQPIWSATGLIFDGLAKQLVTSDSADWFFDGDFSVQVRVTFADILTLDYMGLLAQTQGSDARWQFYYIKTQGLSFYHNVPSSQPLLQNSVVGYSTGVPYNLAITRSGNSWNAYRNGISVASSTTALTMGDWAAGVTIGKIDDAGTFLNATVSGARIFKGIAITDAQRQIIDDMVTAYYANK